MASSHAYNMAQQSQLPTKIIDFRCRPPFKEFSDDWMFNLEDILGHPGIYSKYKKMSITVPDSIREKSMEKFLDERREAGIIKSIVPVRKLPTLNNSHLVQLLQQYPNDFVGFAGFQPFAEGISQCLDDIGKFVEEGPCTGVFMEPALDPIPWEADNELVFPIYERCEKKGIPLCLLFGGVYHRVDAPDYSIYLPMRIEHIAKSFPKLRIAITHACWPWTTAACAMAINWKNVFLSPDGFMINHPGEQDYVIAANYRLQEQFIFGSLYPGLPLGYAVQEYKKRLRPEVWDKVFFENAMHFLGSNEH